MLEQFLRIAFSVIGGLALFILIGYFWGWLYDAPTSQDETAYFRAYDGWRLAVHHYKSEGEMVGLPVILCHGMSANRYPFDLPGASSLARYLKRHGRDVWVPELRGSGMSDRPGIFVADVPYAWTFEDHLRKDLPAVISYILERTGAPAVHWIGHSMGGMLIEAHLATQDGHGIASAVAIGSPTGFEQVRMLAFPILAKLTWLLRYTHVPPMPFIGRFIIPLAHKLPRPLLGLFHPPNIEPRLAGRVVALASTLVTSGTLWRDFARYVETGTFSPKNGRPYVEKLSESPVPLFVIAGSKDRMAPPEAVVNAHDTSRDKGERATLIFGKASGCVEDYGHMDLLIGPRVETEVFPVLRRWLQDHDK